MDFDNIERNITEIENDRYNEIKDKGHFLEFNILIDSFDVSANFINKSDDINGTQPVISLNMHGCTPLTVSFLHRALLSCIKDLEKNYPMETFISKMCLDDIELNEGFRNNTDQKED